VRAAAYADFAGCVQAVVHVAAAVASVLHDEDGLRSTCLACDDPSNVACSYYHGCGGYGPTPPAESGKSKGKKSKGKKSKGKTHGYSY
jgi:hypothetical protein